MEAKERTYNGMLMNGFLALAINLIVLPVLAFLVIYYMMDVEWFSIPAIMVLALAFFIMFDLVWLHPSPFSHPHSVLRTVPSARERFSTVGIICCS